MKQKTKDTLKVATAVLALLGWLIACGWAWWFSIWYLAQRPPPGFG